VFGPPKFSTSIIFRCQKEAAAVAAVDGNDDDDAKSARTQNSHSKTALSMYDGLQQ